jgi:hypothetical protein
MVYCHAAKGIALGRQADLYRKWKHAKGQLEEVFQSPENTLVVHYSCESFYERTDPHSPRITSIAVRNLDSGQTRSLSIHLVAERRRLLGNIEQHYDALEREMLVEFFKYMEVKQNCKWLHWNMRDANYGFEALENRLKALGDEPFHLDERNRFDLSRILIGIYGVGYVGHPRLEKLLELNHITPLDFLTGAQEAAAFVEKQFVKLHQSTLRKVDVLANIADRAHRLDLITLASWWEQNGQSIKRCIEWLKEHWLLSGLSVTITVVGLILKILKFF